MKIENKKKTFYCMTCEDHVECEEEYLSENKGGNPGDCKSGYICNMCGNRLDNTPDADAVYDQMRDDEMFSKETTK